MQVLGQPFNDSGPPPSAFLTFENIASDLPVKKNQLTIDGERGLELGLLDAQFQAVKEFSIALRCDGRCF